MPSSGISCCCCRLQRSGFAEKQWYVDLLIKSTFNALCSKALLKCSCQLFTTCWLSCNTRAAQASCVNMATRAYLKRDVEPPTDNNWPSASCSQHMVRLAISLCIPHQLPKIVRMTDHTCMLFLDFCCRWGQKLIAVHHHRERTQIHQKHSFSAPLLPINC